jgi:hypothetical protein
VEEKGQCPVRWGSSARLTAGVCVLADGRGEGKEDSLSPPLVFSCPNFEQHEHVVDGMKRTYFPPPRSRHLTLAESMWSSTR